MIQLMARSVTLHSLVAAVTVLATLLSLTVSLPYITWREPWPLVVTGLTLAITLFPGRFRGTWALATVLTGEALLTVSLHQHPELRSVCVLLYYTLLMNSAVVLDWPMLLVNLLLAHSLYGFGLFGRNLFGIDQYWVRMLTDLVSFVALCSLVKGMFMAESRIRQLNLRLEELVLKEANTANQVKAELKRTLDLSMDMILTISFEGIVQQVNSAGQTLFGLSPETVNGVDLSTRVHPEDLQTVRAALASAASGVVVQGVQARFRAGKGNWVWMETTGRCLPEERMIFCVARDITERKEAEEALRRAKVVVENSPVVLFRWRLDEGWPVEFASENAHKLGLGDGSRPYSGWVHPDDRERLDTARRDLVLLGSRHTLEYRLHTPDNGVRWVQERVVVERNAEGRATHLQGVVVDVTDAKMAEDRLEHMAFHDALTGLPNRTRFMNRLTEAMREGARETGEFALLFVDLDGFKVVNDSLGHQAGDCLLVEVGRRLSACIGNRGMVARVGGDEFTVLLEGLADPDDGLRWADRVQAALGQPATLEGREIFVTASTGLVLSSVSSDPNELMRFADIAMYQAKGMGKDRVEVYRPFMNGLAKQRLCLETDLRKALERDEFRLVYQPIFTLATGQLTGLEALLRWEHPQRGMISPTEFIPLAEENGLIVPLGSWVMDEACRQLAQWRRQGAAPVTVNVNLSLRQFQHRALAEEYELIVRRHGLQPSDIQLEITESTIMQDPQSTLHMLRRLDEVGFYLALDDFGTGYSAWAHLKGFPVHCIKIDRSFMRGLGQDEESAAIVASMIDLGRALDMDVVAEGIETGQQAASLMSLGCMKGQGYHLARPMPAAEVEQLLAKAAMPGNR